MHVRLYENNIQTFKIDAKSLFPRIFSHPDIRTLLFFSYFWTTIY